MKSQATARLQVCSILLAPQQVDSHMSPRAQVVLMVAYGVMITAGLVCNAAVIMVVVRRSQIQTPRNLFIVNLTVSDITLCLVCMPFTLIALIHNKWVLGETLCKLVPALQVSQKKINLAGLISHHDKIH